LFRALVSTLPRPLKILDVGGTEAFWRQMGFSEELGVTIVILNIAAVRVTARNFTAVLGDARRMSAFGNQAFDVVFSNSVIEHVGSYNDQAQMAGEICRVGKRYFVQTPNRFFPIEPHFLFPFFQFLPESFQALLVSHFALGWYRRATSRTAALEAVRSVRLLTERELRELFPGSSLWRERLVGLTKSFIVYGGWDLL